jgi:hypothetical protein
MSSRRSRVFTCANGDDALHVREVIGEVAKRSNAADCKSVALAASEVRILPSPSKRVGNAECGMKAGMKIIPHSSFRIPHSRERSERVGGSNSVVESQPSKLLVAGSIPVSRSKLAVSFQLSAVVEGAVES